MTIAYSADERDLIATAVRALSEAEDALDKLDRAAGHPTVSLHAEEHLTPVAAAAEAFRLLLPDAEDWCSRQAGRSAAA